METIIVNNKALEEEIEEIEEIEEKRIEKMFPVYDQFGLASVVTILGTVMGLMGVMFAIQGVYYMTIICIQAAILCDSIDGPIARKTNKASQFGEQLDSLSDFFNFVAAPCIIGFVVGHTSIYAIISYIIFLGAGISRLALFNISSQAYKRGKKAFVGMPVPMATAVLFCGFATVELLQLTNNILIIPAIYAVLGLLMVSGIKIVKYGLVTVVVTSMVLSLNIYLLSIIA